MRVRAGCGMVYGVWGVGGVGWGGGGVRGGAGALLCGWPCRVGYSMAYAEGLLGCLPTYLHGRVRAPCASIGGQPRLVGWAGRGPRGGGRGAGGTALARLGKPRRTSPSAAPSNPPPCAPPAPSQAHPPQQEDVPDGPGQLPRGGGLGWGPGAGGWLVEGGGSTPRGRQAGGTGIPALYLHALPPPSSLLPLVLACYCLEAKPGGANGQAGHAACLNPRGS